MTLLVDMTEPVDLEVLGLIAGVELLVAYRLTLPPPVWLPHPQFRYDTTLRVSSRNIYWAVVMVKSMGAPA